MKSVPLGVGATRELTSSKASGSGTSLGGRGKGQGKSCSGKQWDTWKRFPALFQVDTCGQGQRTASYVH